MSRRSKLFAKLANESSDANWSLDEVAALLGFNDFVQLRQNGSHRVFARDGYEKTIVLAPHGKTIKPIYIKGIRQNFAIIEQRNQEQP